MEALNEGRGEGRGAEQSHVARKTYSGRLEDFQRNLYIFNRGYYIPYILIIQLGINLLIT